MDGAYAQLEHSLGLVQDKLGEECCRRLVDMARASKEALVEGELKKGLLILQDMIKLLDRKGVTVGSHRE